MTDQGRWLYAITDRGTTDNQEWLASVAGVADRPVRPVRSSGLTALVSDVDLGEFGADALRRNLEDLRWLEEVAWAHHQVIEAVSRHVSPLPIRLATVYRGDASVTMALREREREFASALAHVRDRVEWGVKAYAAAPPAPVGGHRSRGGVPGTGSAGTGSPAGETGVEYLKRRRDELAASQDTRRDATASARALHAELAGQAAGARLHPPQSARLSGSTAPMLLNAAYLLSRSDGTSFAAAVAAAASARPELRLELTGPWPPYSFAGGDA
jgi:hypothetical protein